MHTNTAERGVQRAQDRQGAEELFNNQGEKTMKSQQFCSKPLFFEIVNRETQTDRQRKGDGERARAAFPMSPVNHPAKRE